MKIHYIRGDATAPGAAGNKIIAHICNDLGGWGKGFVMALSAKWKAPEAAYRQWYKTQDHFTLGEMQLVMVANDTWVANMIAQRDIKPRDGVPPIRYEALESCLSKLVLAAKENHASVHMPRIGCGLAGGKWEDIEPILLKTLVANDVETYVYDRN